MHACLQITDRNYKKWLEIEPKQIIFEGYLIEISWEYDLNEHKIYLEPLEVQWNSLYTVIWKF